MASVVMQRYIRGGIARLKVGRMRRKIARAEFEKARARFRAAQKVQALTRGVQQRRRARERQAKAAKAATTIQKIARGRALRKRMWQHVTERSATVITARARGFLVRNRKFELIAKVICIQRAYRKWLQRDPRVRQAHHQRMLLRKQQATKLQRHWRQFAERREIRCIHASLTT